MKITWDTEIQKLVIDGEDNTVASLTILDADDCPFRDDIIIKNFMVDISKQPLNS
jgi:hypothetical protein